MLYPYEVPVDRAAACVAGASPATTSVDAPIYVNQNGNRSSGYMLLDLALALTIVLLLFAVVWPFAGSGTSHAQQAATALDIATLLRVDRSSASSSGRSMATRFDLARRTVTSATGRRVEIPSDVAMTVTTGAECMEGAQRFTIVFAPDGTSCGGVVLLSKGVQSYAVRINWLSGMIDVVSGQKI